MRLNKNTLYVLVYLIGGATTAPEIGKKMPQLDIRSIQRALERLMDTGLITRSGPINSPTYSLQYQTLLAAEFPEKILEDEERPESMFNHALLDWLETVPTDLLEPFSKSTTSAATANGSKIAAKELEYLTVELSWKSSALEGNTYTLLDTQLLLTEGIKAKGRTEFETQMILNHKDALAFIVENADLFSGRISFSTVEELHRIIGRNLGIPAGVRKKIVKISASNYTPPASPQQLREGADRILSIIDRFTDPVIRSLLALSLIPYLQIFEDGNKRTGRMLANAMLISTIGRGFSLRKVSARELALAYLAFYEFNSLKQLSDILNVELS
jgi:predicted transcriptional regulator